MFILHNVPKNKRQVGWAHPWKTGGWGWLSFIQIFSYDLPERDKNSIWVSVNRWKNPDQKYKNEKQISRLTTRFAPFKDLHTKSQKSRGAVEGWFYELQQLQMLFGLSIRVALRIFIFFMHFPRVKSRVNQSMRIRHV